MRLGRNAVNRGIRHATTPRGGKGTAARDGASDTAVVRGATGDLPHHESDGYLVRDAHRAFQRLLEERIAPHGVTRGQWYFLRVLWTKDGLSQRELSERVGMMEPTTVIALRSMEKAGLIRRVRSTDDRRVTHVLAHRQGQAHARRTVDARARASMRRRTKAFRREDIAVFRRVIARMTKNLDKVGQ